MADLRAVLAAATALVFVGACQLLPERYAVNAPLRNLVWGGGIAAATPDVLHERLKTPDGFTVSLWASDLPNARFLRFTPAGDLLVGQPREGIVTIRMPAAEQAERAKRGGALYDDFGCAGCHEAGAAAAGVVPHPLSHLGRRWTVDGLVSFLATPTPPMPPVEASADQRRDLAVYLLTKNR